MDRREFLKRSSAGVATIVGSSLLGVTGSASEGEAQAAARPNFLVICTDDQPWQTLARMQKVAKRLIARGSRFDNGYVVTDERELYDLSASADPYQMHSLHDDPERGQQMGDFAAKLAALRSSGGDTLRAAEEA
jgi:hypothetical protein